jgi:hypothetical protein
MEEKRKIYETFLSFNAHKASVTDVPTVHAFFYHSGTMSPAIRLITMSPDDVKEELDMGCELVRWLMHQLHTYDCHTQRIVALIFDRQTVLSDVFDIHAAQSDLLSKHNLDTINVSGRRP